MPILPPIPEQPAHNALVLFGPTPAQLNWIVGSIHADNEANAKSLAAITQKLEILTMATDKLNQSVADLHTEVGNHASKIEAELQQLIDAHNSGDQAGIDAAEAAIRGEITALQGQDTSLDADDAAPAPAPPTA